MTRSIAEAAPSSRTLRLWPGVIAATVLVVVRYLLPLVVVDASGYGVLGGALCAVAILVWWLLFSRARWSERLGVVAVMAGAMLLVRPFLHPSISGAGMGILFYVSAIMLMAVALVAWASFSRRLAGGRRWASMMLALVLASGAHTLVRTEGVTGDGGSDIRWRWTPTAEERLLSATVQSPRSTVQPTVQTQPATIPVPAEVLATSTPTDAAGAAAVATAPAPIREAEWPGFRGPRRDGVVRGVRLDPDWATHPPALIWKRPVGPGWSSFSVAGDFIFTQEQRGDDEMVSCYRLSSGEPVWVHADPARFYESNGGAGPRATPTVHGGRVYSFGATGIVNALDVASGRVIWSRNAATDTGREIPGWGFAGSPLAIDGTVVIAVSGQLIAYDAGTGSERWRGPARGGGYSSPHIATIDGVRQILLLSGGGAIGVSPVDGALLWEHTWEPGASITQPAIADGGVLISGVDMMGGIGTRRLVVSRTAAGWTQETQWTSRGLKPYFSDLVVHGGYAYGFDGTILAAIDLSDGTRKWKGGRYGAGQLILLSEQDLLLVLAEEGDLALVKAMPDQFTEVARVPGIEGKTWNHPVLVGDLLLVRNGEEMAAFRLRRK